MNLVCPKHSKEGGREEEGRIRKAKQRKASISEVSMKAKSAKKYSVIKVSTNLYDWQLQAKLIRTVSTARRQTLASPCRKTFAVWRLSTADSGCPELCSALSWAPIVLDGSSKAIKSGFSHKETQIFRPVENPAESRKNPHHLFFFFFLTLPCYGRH